MNVCTCYQKATSIKKAIAWIIFACMPVILTMTSVPEVRAEAGADLLRMPAPRIPVEIAVRSVFLDIAAAGNRHVAVGEYGMVLYSDDGGASWQQADVPTSVTLTAVHFPTPLKGWAVGHDGVVINTEDGGKSWQMQLSGLEVNKKALAQIKEKASQLSAALETAAQADRSELERRLEDMELLASDLSVPLDDKAPTPLMDVLFLNDKQGIAVGAFGILIQTMDGGQNWEPILDRMDNVDGFHYYGIDTLKKDGIDLMFIVGEAGMVMRSTDLGQTWERLPDVFEGTFFGITAGQDQLLAYGLGGKAFLSNDFGDSWQPTQPTDNRGQAISGATALPGGRFVMTTNNGVLLHLKEDTGEVTKLAVQVAGCMAAARTENGNMVIAGTRGIKPINNLDKKGG